MEGALEKKKNVDEWEATSKSSEKGGEERDERGGKIPSLGKGQLSSSERGPLIGYRRKENLVLRTKPFVQELRWKGREGWTRGHVKNMGFNENSAGEGKNSVLGREDSRPWRGRQNDRVWNAHNSAHQSSRKFYICKEGRFYRKKAPGMGKGYRVKASSL